MKNKKGFTLVELLAVIVVLAILILIAVSAVMPVMKKAKKNSLFEEALVYLKAAEQAYSIEGEVYENRTCINISELNGEYVKKDSGNYTGAIITTNVNGKLVQTINLTDGEFYVVGTDSISKSDVKNEKPAGFAESCGNYNPVLSLDDNTLFAHKLLMAEGGSTLDANLEIIDDRTSSINFTTGTVSDADSGLYVSEDDEGASYYYRGNVSNNWVEFGGFYWRVIRINGDGSIRLIYTGLNSANHTGDYIGIKNSKNTYPTAYANASSNSITTPDITGLTTNQISINYNNGRFANTYAGYMYNPAKVLSTYPTFALSNSKRLNNFPTYSSISNSKNDYYFFKNFNRDTDCYVGNSDDETGTCVLKCRSLGTDCITGNWNSIATTAGNYSSTADGVYPATNPTQNIYTSEFKYSCWANATPVVKSNSDGTTSVYISCPLVTEILGTVNNQPTQAKVRYHGLFSESADAANQNLVDSNAKKELELWYQNNIINRKDSANVHNLEEYLTDEIYCNDRTSPKTNFPFDNTASYQYGGYVRLYSQKKPSFKCPTSRDAFTLGNFGNSSVSPKSIGNGLMKYPVGLITGDELAFAGFTYNIANTTNYLHVGKNFWSMSPFLYSINSGAMGILLINSSGKLTNASSSSTYFLRPVINLSSSVKYSSGTGTEADPYKVTLSTT